MRGFIRRIIACIAFCIAICSGQERVDVFLDSIIGVASYRGTGFIQGPFSGDMPADSLLIPLKINFLRGSENDITIAYNRCKAYGATMEVVTNNWTKWENTPMGVNNNWTAWEKYHRDLVSRMRSKKMGDVHYGIFTESCSKGLGWTGANQPLFLEAYRRAYLAIRQIDPAAKIVGPNAQYGPENTWWWPLHSGDNTWFVRQFLDYCIANKCVPDIIAWHDYSCDGLGIIKDAGAVRNFCKDRGITAPVLEEDDLGCKEGQFRPGIFVSYLANIERAKISYTAKCCWDNDCWGNTLNGLLTKSTREKRSLWWLYKAYADLAGNIVSVRQGTSVDAVASLDSVRSVVRCVIGRYRNVNGPLTLRLITGGTKFTQVHVAAYRIPNSEALALSAPSKTIDQTYTLATGRIDIVINDLNAYDSYALTATLTGNSGTFHAAAKPVNRGTAWFILNADRTISIRMQGAWVFTLADISGRIRVRLNGNGPGKAILPPLAPGCYSVQQSPDVKNGKKMVLIY